MINNITCFGEILWDIFPEEKKIGGAPLNVAIRLKSLGANVAIISSVGFDKLGSEILDLIQQHGLNIDFVNVHNSLSTGQVDVFLDEKGSATYNVKKPTAWDEIPLLDDYVRQVKLSDAFVFGSLSARNKISRNTLLRLISHATFNVFDVNLRAPHYDIELINLLMSKANFIKLNDDELFEICYKNGSKFNSLEQNIRFISQLTETGNICVTKGRHGGVLFTNKKLYYNSGFCVKVTDTVGAGDSFLATLIYYFLKKEDPQFALDMACAMGALVAKHTGANPSISLTKLNDFIYPKKV